MAARFCVARCLLVSHNFRAQPALLFLILFLNRKEIKKTMRVLEVHNQYKGKDVLVPRTVQEYAEEHPAAVRDIVSSTRSISMCFGKGS